jgi:glyoxylase-like metal-dependent hydrolase (beta-lactamase superfamily II)
MRVHFFATGFARVPKGLFVEGAPWRSVRFPILSLVVESGGELILLDTGLGTRFEEELKPRRYRGNWFFNRFVMRTAFDADRDPLVRQLPAHGLDVSAVKYAILSHLHWDHASGMRDFPNATFIVGQREWEAATAPDSHRHAYVREQYADGTKLRIERVSTVPGRSFFGFPASLDLLGDGRFVLVDLPGHTPGSMGIFVTLPSGRRFLYGGDAFYFPENLEWRAPKSLLMRKLVHERPEAGETLRKLHALANREPGLEMVGCHDHRIPGRYDLAPAHCE